MGWLNNRSELRRLRKALDKAERQRDDERVRHLAREDALVNRCLTGAGKYGLSERSAPEVTEPAPLVPTDPFAGWTAEERAFDIKCFRDAGHPNPEQAAEDAYIANYLNRQT